MKVHFLIQHRFLAIAIALAFFARPLQVAAQITDSLLLLHPEYTASGYSVYPEPDKSVKYTKAPAGYKPFYISHYGRHGSRYHYSADDYKYLYETLAKADSAKALSELGKRAMEAARALAENAAPRTGDLTQVGVKQHEGIARRMAKNFAEVFDYRKGAKDTQVGVKQHEGIARRMAKNFAEVFDYRKGAKDLHIDAFASTSGRCIVSMAAFTGGLRASQPSLDIRMESGKGLMGFINNFNFDMTKNYAETAEYKAESDKLWQHISTSHFIQELFQDTDYVQKNINVPDFYNKMFEISGSIQGMDETGNLLILDSLFTTEEKISRWKAQNAWWYSVLGNCPLTGDDGVNTAKPILKHIIDEADKAIAATASDSNTLQNTAATLRFGHDTGLLPLAGLMQLSVASAKVTDLSKLHEQWTDFRIIPMAANLQIIFYKKNTNSSRSSKKASPAGNTKTDDILVKFLYNEREVTAPIPCGATAENSDNAHTAKCPNAPYYRWDDVKNFYLPLIK